MSRQKFLISALFLRRHIAARLLWKGTILSRLGMYPKRVQNKSHANGHCLFLETIVHFHSYARYQILHTGKRRHPRVRFACCRQMVTPASHVGRLHLDEVLNPWVLLSSIAVCYRPTVKVSASKQRQSSLLRESGRQHKCYRPDSPVSATVIGNRTH
jgi:hypothetical protein